MWCAVCLSIILSDRARCDRGVCGMRGLGEKGRSKSVAEIKGMVHSIPIYIYIYKQLNICFFICMFVFAFFNFRLFAYLFLYLPFFIYMKTYETVFLCVYLDHPQPILKLEAA